MPQVKFFWIDAVKAICMFAVYLLHSETYYGTGGTSYGYVLQPFYVNAFFFVSGYLFFRKYLDKEQLEKVSSSKGYWMALENTLFRLVIPTILFSSIIYLPKVFFHTGDVVLKDYFFDVFGGISFWFTSALVVAQVILLSLLLFKQTHVGFYLIITLLLAALGMYLNLERESNGPDAFFPWFYKTGLVYTFVMALGGLYFRYENRIDKIMKYAWIIPAVIYVCLLVLTWESHALKMIGLGGICNVSGFVEVLCGIVLIVLLSKQLPMMRFVEFIGRNSIVFYFFSGALPASIGWAFQKMFPDKLYIMTVAVAMLSVVMGYFLTFIVVNYFPWLTDFRKLKKSCPN